MANIGTTQTLYFAYGSNLWMQQMKRRCPTSSFKGLARLPHRRWIINTRGYANVVPSDGDEVWGMIYALLPPDEAGLDLDEGVPWAYQKQMLKVEVRFEDADKCGNTSQPFQTALCYVDTNRVQEGQPNGEYVHRINMGIRDAKKGMPSSYVDKYLRPFIPAEEGKRRGVGEGNQSQDPHEGVVVD